MKHVGTTRKLVALPAILLALHMAAAAGDVQAFPARGVDLASFKTFKMLPIRVLSKYGVVENDPDVSPFIAAALRKELREKGLTEVSEGADLEVSAGALAVSIPQVEVIIYNLALDADWGTSPITTIGRYNREGTLIVNLIDPRVNKSAWLGFDTRALGRPSALKKDIDKAADALFKKYPAIK